MLREKVRATRGAPIAWHFLDDDRRESSETNRLRGTNSSAGDVRLVFP